MHYNVSIIDDVLEADLLQTDNIVKHNDGYNLLLVVIDVLSKFVWVEPIKDRFALTVTNPFEKILKRASRRQCLLLQTGQIKVLENSFFQNYLDKRSIKFRVAQNLEIKNDVLER